MASRLESTAACSQCDLMHDMVKYKVDRSSAVNYLADDDALNGCNLPCRLTSTNAFSGELKYMLTCMQLMNLSIYEMHLALPQLGF